MDALVVPEGPVMPACVFRSTDPTVIAAEDDRGRMLEDYGARVAEWRSRFPDHNVVVLRSDRRVWLSRLEGPDLGYGWRFDKAKGGWVPDRRTTAGKGLGAEFDSMSVDIRARLPGMPGMAVVGGRWFEHGLRRFGDLVYVTWGCEPQDVEGDVDLTLWERVRLSEYYAALEAAQEGA